MYIIYTYIADNFFPVSGLSFCFSYLLAIKGMYWFDYWKVLQ